MDPDIENVNPNTEIRKLHLSHLNELITLLETGDSWKKLMAIIPKQLNEHGFQSDITLHNKAKFTSSDFSIIIETAEKYHRKPTEILFQEWGTMGPRPRVNLGHLKYLLVKAELLAAAKYVANLLREAPPERPPIGPGAAISIPSDFENEHVNTPSTVQANTNEDEEVQRRLDEIGYVGRVVEQIRRKSKEIHYHQVEPIVPDIVITEDQPTPEPTHIPIVTQRPRMFSTTIKSPPNPIDIDTNPQDGDFIISTDTTRNIPDFVYLLPSPPQPIDSLGEHEHAETNSTANEFISESIMRDCEEIGASSVLANSDDANLTMSSDDNIPVLHILNHIGHETAPSSQENRGLLICQQSNPHSEEMLSNSMYNSSTQVQRIELMSQDCLSNETVQSIPLVLQYMHNNLESKELHNMSKSRSAEMMSNSMYNSTQGILDPLEVTTSESDLIPLVLPPYHNNLEPKQMNVEPKIYSEVIKSNYLHELTTDMQLSNVNPQDCLSNESEYSIPLMVQQLQYNFGSKEPKLDCTLANLSIDSPLPHYNYEALKNATKFFSKKPEVFLGSGGFGSVFLARDLSAQSLAVKKMNRVLSTNNEYDILKEFKREVETMHRYVHPNLVSLLGYSCDTDNYCLVYEFVSGGSLFEVLRDRPKSLQWLERVGIALGTAKGVAYLHTAFEPPMVHRDVKSANILLDPNGNVKVCDYGISKFIPDGVTFIDESSCGTSAYMPPEYTMENQVSLKMDSFSFGVVLLELLTSLSPLDPNRNEGVDLVSYSSYKCRESKSIDPILDQSIGKWEHHEINFSKELYNLVLRCLETKENRPLVTDILFSLEKVSEHLD